ncbi:VPLPA-CTERM sorting domain-containing protein [Oceanicoccus sagamiensis]|uniref:VPLPA-CTERM sorting domain-containing protein n=1 Tax=Oceanicoccus sagamiensis TaxID=716816 RepID=A0A1X9NMJ5_9GAMM|nr:VPLPA-CTERM sorting domain-containing protein [Oceanicoccus sagamiensis]ARN75133.1 hypothetical protein BST96_14015 [Oceanicoccus sagamiensis]
MTLTPTKTLAVSALALTTAINASALTLTGNGLQTQLQGTLGSVDVMSTGDYVGNTGYLGANGIVSPAPQINGRRVQYDMHNKIKNGDIFHFTVWYEQGIEVLGAGVPGGYISENGVVTDWLNSNYMMRFDNGYGNYHYELFNGGQWAVEYNPDNIKWILFGEGMPGGSAIGRTDVGNKGPRFSILFPEDVSLELQDAVVFGNNRSATGQVLSATSAVPVPAAAWLFGSALLGLTAVGRKRK